MKNGPFMSYNKRKNFKKKKKNSAKTMAWKVVPGPYVFVKN